MNVTQAGRSDGLPPGVSVAVLRSADSDARYCERIRDVLLAAGAATSCHDSAWTSRATTQQLGVYTGLVYVVEQKPPNLVASIDAFIEVMKRYREARPLRLGEFLSGLQPFEVGLVQLVMDGKALRDPYTRSRLQRVADRVHARDNGQVLDVVGIYHRRMPHVQETVDRYVDPVADAARRRLRDSGITRMDQVNAARRRLSKLMEEFDDVRLSVSSRPILGKDLNALALVLTDRQPLRAVDGRALYADAKSRDKKQETLNRAVTTALTALQKEPGLESVRLTTAWRGRVEAMYHFYQDLNTVHALGIG